MLRVLLSPARLLVVLLFSSQAFAECGGTVQCIGVGATPQDAEVAHHGLGPATFTLDFGNQVIATTSNTKNIYVAAVTGEVSSNLVYAS